MIKKRKRVLISIFIPLMIALITVIIALTSIERENDLFSKSDILNCEVYIQHNDNRGLPDSLGRFEDVQVVRVTQEELRRTFKTHFMEARPFRSVVKELDDFTETTWYYSSNIYLKNERAYYKIQFIDMQTQCDLEYFYRDQPVIRVTKMRILDKNVIQEWDYLFTIPSYEFFQLAVLAFEYDSSDEILDMDIVGIYEGG